MAGKNLKKKEVKSNPKWFYLVLTVIPLIIIVILEILLKSFGYGIDFSTFVQISDRFENYKFFNPQLPRKYFGDSPITPSVIPDGFRENKPKEILRIFALGGSTTAGFPHPPNGSFPRLFKNQLQKQYPSKDFEVINLGISAVNTITIRDIIDDVLNEEPDLIILYAGHNEYYGALGPASNVKGFYNLSITRLVLNLKEYRTVQLIENLIKHLVSLFSEDNAEKKTLMSEVAGKNLVHYNSEEFINGVNQFESNLDYILSRCNERGIPTFVGTLASNLFQEPLCKYAGCDSLFSEFKSIVSNSDSNVKEKLYEVKDNDELRFRAPEVLNEAILKYAKKYNCKVFDVKKLFENNSPYEIIGDNLMLDHLHPTFDGNYLIAELLFSMLQNTDILNSIPNKEIPFRFSNDFGNNFAYSDLDSSFANLRVKYLKNDFPFSKKKKNVSISHFNKRSLADSLAQDMIDGSISWESAHLKLADYYYERKNYEKFVNEINVLIEDKPFDKFPYLKAIKSLEKDRKTDLVKYFLHKYHRIYPDLFSSRKLADIYFSQKRHEEAIYFYKICKNYINNDPKIHFNLSACYYGVKDLPNALQNIKRCLELNPNYPNAQKIYQGLLNIYQSRK